MFDCKILGILTVKKKKKFTPQTKSKERDIAKQKPWERYKKKKKKNQDDF